MKHTPGPWFIEEEDSEVIRGTFAISDDLSTLVAHVEAWDESDEEAQEQAKANAHLIAAAPELLEALEQIIAGWDAPTYGDHEALIDHLFPAIELARTVIAKAGRRD